jgi:hypothetical protein
MALATPEANLIRISSGSRLFWLLIFEDRLEIPKHPLSISWNICDSLFPNMIALLK